MSPVGDSISPESDSGGMIALASGWYIDEPAQLEAIYGRVSPPLRVDRRLWQIRTPFLMDLQAAKVARLMEGGEEARPRRRGGRARPDGRTGVDGFPAVEALERLMKERTAAAHTATPGPKPTAGGSGDDPVATGGPTPDEYRENNSTARQAARSLLENAENITAPFSAENDLPSPRVVTVQGGEYVLPAGSRLLCDDVTRAFDDVSVAAQLAGRGKFNCVLMDPPWTNKHVKRKRKHDARDGYRSLEAASLARLPMARLAADGALVAVWCTNKPAHQATLRSVLFPAWGVQECATWHWIKVTQYGQPVADPADGGKQPYEVLVLGRRGAAPAGLPEPPSSRVMVSVPAALHSRKPLLNEILAPYLPAGYRGLEVFARGLLPGWTAWGDQPLLLQRIGAVLLPPPLDGTGDEENAREGMEEASRREGRKEACG